MHGKSVLLKPLEGFKVPLPDGFLESFLTWHRCLQRRWHPSSSEEPEGNPGLSSFPVEVLVRRQTAALGTKVGPSRPWHLGIFRITLALLAASKRVRSSTSRVAPAPVAEGQTLRGGERASCLIYLRASRICRNHLDLYAPFRLRTHSATLPCRINTRFGETERYSLQNDVEKLLILRGDDEVFATGGPTDGVQSARFVHLGSPLVLTPAPVNVGWARTWHGLMVRGQCQG